MSDKIIEVILGEFHQDTGFSVTLREILVVGKAENVILAGHEVYKIVMLLLS